jgi:hypothetical protein
MITFKNTYLVYMIHLRPLGWLLVISVLVTSCQKSSTSQEEATSADSLTSTTSPAELENTSFALADLPQAMVLKSVMFYSDTTFTVDSLGSMPPLSMFSLGTISTPTMQQVFTPQKKMGYVLKADLAIPNDFLPPTIIHSFERDYVLFTVTDGGLVPLTDDEEMFDSKYWHLLLYSPYEDIFLPVKLMVKDMPPFCMENGESTMHFFSTTALPSIQSVKSLPHAAEITLVMGFQDGTHATFKLSLEEGSDNYELVGSTQIDE